jgi:hypothetical protein
MRRETWPGVMVLGGCLGVVLLVWVVVFLWNGDDDFLYAIPVDEALVTQRFLGKRVVVQGCRAARAALQGGEPCRVAFKLEQSWQSSLAESARPNIDVFYERCDLPDTFSIQPDLRLELSVEGRLVSQGGRRSIAAERVLAKCPAKYEPSAGGCPRCRPGPCGDCEPERPER